jgi:hypothetical protein
MAAVRAMEQGVRRHGHRVVTHRQDQGYVPCDIAVMWGCYKKTMPETACRDGIVAAHADRPFVRLERGYLQRDQHEAVGLNGLWGHADYRNDNSPGDRFEKLGLRIMPWRQTPAGHILVMGQVPRDTSVQHLDFEAWVRATCGSLRAAAPGREVRFRPHPVVQRTRPLEEDLDGAECVVALTSTSAVDALLAGVPTVVTDRGSVCWELCGGAVRDALHPPRPDRTEFFRDLAYAQWTHEEMARGDPWAHLFRP